MGKQKQSKLYRLNKEKSKQHKQQMKTVMKQLAQSKQKNTLSITKLTAITEINQKNKKIHKQHKDQKFQIKQKQKQCRKQQQDQISQELKQNTTEHQTIQSKPKFNIFAAPSYDSGIKTQINNQIIEQQIDETVYMQNKARQIMGESFTVQNFGDKPLRVIEQTQKVQLSDDQDQPNSLKNIFHPDIKIPYGSHFIDRKKTIQQFRKSLPIVLKEQQLIQTINNNLVTLICGETGSGKSTQLPQFLIQKNYHKFGKIAVTQPRRLATISLASRVADQVNTRLGQFVGYQVRHQRKDSSQTFIKFMTDGILLNQMNSDFLLQQYSVVVIDEAHERKINTDILIGLLSRVVLIRYKMSLQNKCNPLRIVIMSATMRIDDFKNITLFNFSVPILKVEARMFPVTTFYEKNTPEDYKKAAIKKCVKIHRTLPDGDVLIFLTGKEEIHEMKVLLEQELERQNFLESQMLQMDEQEQQEQMEIQEQQKEVKQNQDEKQKQADQQILPEQQNQKGGRKGQTQTKKHPTPTHFVIFQLYSSLPLQEQSKIFLPQPEGTRKFIIATNIAETSITIPNIRYVVDSGQEKHRFFDKVWKWKKGWGSKAMAQQRAGRAGRTSHGYCYRLYSAALYGNIMQEFPPPQILKQPLDSTLLQLKSIGVQNVYSFPFPTKPQSHKISETLQKLINLKALLGSIKVKQEQETTKITHLGQVLSFIPLDPKLGKMLLLGRQKKVEKYVLFIVILLTVENIYHEQRMSKFFQRDIDDDTTKQNLKQKYLEELRAKSFAFKGKFQKYIDQEKNGDIFTAINVLGEFFCRIYSTLKEGYNKKIQRIVNQQSKLLNLNQNTMRQVYYNADQICEIFSTLCGQTIDLSSYTKPTSSEIECILDIMLETFIQNVCRHRQKNKYQNRDQKTIHVHNLSPLYMKSHMYVGCVDYYETEFNRTYMKYPFLIRNYQLLSQFGQILQEKQYVWRDEQIVGKTQGVIYGWEIPNLYLYSPKDKSQKWIALTYLILSGQVFQQLKALKKYLQANLNTIRSENLDYKLQKITQKLKILQIQTKAQLLQWFKNDKHFLQKQLQLFYNMKNFNQAYSRIREEIIRNDKSSTARIHKNTEE